MKDGELGEIGPGMSSNSPHTATAIHASDAAYLGLMAVERVSRSRKVATTTRRCSLS
jgi:hypothetical protein